MMSTLYCFTASQNNGPLAIPSIEGTHKLINDSYVTRTDKVVKCARVTMSRGYTYFAVLQGKCLSAINAELTYQKHGYVYSSSGCSAEGEQNKMAVYKLTIGAYHLLL